MTFPEIDIYVKGNSIVCNNQRQYAKQYYLLINIMLRQRTFTHAVNRREHIFVNKSKTLLRINVLKLYLHVCCKT